MCGISGFIHVNDKFIEPARILIQDLLGVGTIRGSDSSGIFRVDKNNVRWAKAAQPGWRFPYMEDVIPTFERLGDAEFVVAHNRAATHGDINNNNAHPFEYKNICLVHNGTIMKSKGLTQNKSDVDSEMIAHSIADQGIGKTKDIMWGAYSLVWHDAEEKTLNFLRNKERPMWFLTTEQGLILFCSEPGMGKWIAQRRGFDVINVYQTREDVMYSFSAVHGSRETAIETEMKPVRPTRIFNLFSKPQQKSPEEKKKLLELARTYKSGELFQFSLTDFNEKDKKGKFVRISGELVANIDVTCGGNFSGSTEELYAIKTLMCGTITSIQANFKTGKILLNLKDIFISDTPDPIFIELKNEIVTPKEKNHRPTQCDECHHVFTRSNCDNPYPTIEAGKVRVLCVSCVMDRPSNAAAN